MIEEDREKLDKEQLLPDVLPETRTEDLPAMPTPPSDGMGSPFLSAPVKVLPGSQEVLKMESPLQ